jgi:hypothetical protein
MPWLSKAVRRTMVMEMDFTGARQQVANGSMRLCHDSCSSHQTDGKPCDGN